MNYLLALITFGFCFSASAQFSSNNDVAYVERLAQDVYHKLGGIAQNSTPFLQPQEFASLMQKADIMAKKSLRLRQLYMGLVNIPSDKSIGLIHGAEMSRMSILGEITNIRSTLRPYNIALTSLKNSAKRLRNIPKVRSKLPIFSGINSTSDRKGLKLAPYDPKDFNFKKNRSITFNSGQVTQLDSLISETEVSKPIEAAKPKLTVKQSLQRVGEFLGRSAK